MDADDTRPNKEKHYRVLKALYEEARGNVRATIDKDSFLRKLGFERREGEEVLAELDSLKMIKAMRHYVSLSQDGIKEMINKGSTLLAEGLRAKVDASKEKDAVDGDAEFMTVTVADIYLKEGQVDKAITVLEHIVAQEPKNEEARKKLEKARGEVKKHELAEESRLYHIVCSPGLKVEPGKDRRVYNACLGMDIIGFTKETNYQLQQLWIKQFYGILDELFGEFAANSEEFGKIEYLLIMVGDGAYLCFLNPESISIHFSFLERFKEELGAVNRSANRKVEGGKGWSVRSALTFGQDYLTRYDFGSRKFVNIYGPTITGAARLLQVKDDIPLVQGEKMEDSDIRVGGAVHSSIEGDQYFKGAYKQIKAQATVKGKDYDFVVYRKK